MTCPSFYEDNGPGAIKSAEEAPSELPVCPKCKSELTVDEAKKVLFCTSCGAFIPYIALCKGWEHAPRGTFEKPQPKFSKEVPAHAKVQSNEQDIY